jgi:hypothetical protein
VVVGSGGCVVVGSGGWVVVGSVGRAVVAGGEVVTGIGVVAGCAGDCTFPVEALLPHAPARTASVPTVVVFIPILLVACVQFPAGVE